LRALATQSAIGLLQLVSLACGTTRVDAVERAPAPASAPIEATSSHVAPATPSLPPPVYAPSPSAPSSVDAGSDHSSAVDVTTSTQDAALSVSDSPAGLSDAGLALPDAGSPCKAPGIVDLNLFQVVLRTNSLCLRAGGPVVSKGRPTRYTWVAECNEYALWQLVGARNGTFEIRQYPLAVNVETLNGGTNEGVDLVLMPPADDPVQHFIVRELDNGYVSFVLAWGATPNLCMTESRTTTAELVKCDPKAESQQWLLRPAPCGAVDAGN
jgi:hypothetical protein